MAGNFQQQQGRQDDYLRLLKKENSNLKHDIKQLINVITSARVSGRWDIESARFRDVTTEQVFGTLQQQFEQSLGPSDGDLRSLTDQVKHCDDTIDRLQKDLEFVTRKKQDLERQISELESQGERSSNATAIEESNIGELVADLNIESDGEDEPASQYQKSHDKGPAKAMAEGESDIDDIDNCLASLDLESEERASQNLEVSESDSRPTVSKCNRSNCKLCTELIEGHQYEFKCGETATVNENISCGVENVIYALICSGCEEEYIGETKNLRKRMTVHRQRIGDPALQIQLVSKHIATCSTTAPKFRVFPIFKMPTDDTELRLEKETELIKRYNPKLTTYKKG